MKMKRYVQEIGQVTLSWRLLKTLPQFKQLLSIIGFLFAESDKMTK